MKRQSNNNNGIEGDFSFFDTIVSLVKPNMETGPWIAGGYPLALYLQEKLSCHDIDIFFADQEQRDECFETIAKHFKVVDTFDDLIDEPENPFAYSKQLSVGRGNPTAIHTTSNAMTFSDGFGREVQLIWNWHPDNLKDLFDTFDFTCCMVATDGEHLYMSPETKDDIDNRRLVLSKTTNRKQLLRRFVKYGLTYGFKPTRYTIETILREKDTISWEYSRIDGY